MLKNYLKIKGKVRSAHVLAVLFLLFLFYVAWAGLSDMFIQTGQAMQIRLSPQWFIRQTNELYENMLSTDTQYSFLQNKGTYINLNGFMANALGQPESNEHIKLKNGHLAGIRSDPPEPEEIHSAAENIIHFYQDHTANGGDFLFVLVSGQVSKYEDLLPVGYTDTAHNTADVFLGDLIEAGVPYLDLREEMENEGISVTDAYFVTDHHWKPQAGFWAYGKILDKLAQMEVIEPVDPFYTDPDNFTFETYENTFLGSSGKRTGIYYAGLDDSILIKPNFETDITIDVPFRNLKLSGRYEDVAYNTDVHHNYENPDFYQENVYGLYGWGDMDMTHWRNEHAADQSNFLLIGESYGNIPFSLMSLCLGRCDEMDLRYYKDDFPAYYHSYQPDTVVLELSVGSVLTEFTSFGYLR